MILVDSSVWVDFFQGKTTPQVQFLKARVGMEMLSIGDLILAEVLQGFRHDKDYRQAEQVLASFPILTLGGERIAIKAAQYYRILRKKGVTVRGTVDMIIAAYCLENRLPLLYADRDFDAMVKHLGLRNACG